MQHETMMQYHSSEYTLVSTDLHEFFFQEIASYAKQLKKIFIIDDYPDYVIRFAGKRSMIQLVNDYDYDIMYYRNYIFLKKRYSNVSHPINIELEELYLGCKQMIGLLENFYRRKESSSAVIDDVVPKFFKSLKDSEMQKMKIGELAVSDLSSGSKNIIWDFCNIFYIGRRLEDVKRTLFLLSNLGNATIYCDKDNFNNKKISIILENNGKKNDLPVFRPEFKIHGVHNDLFLPKKMKKNKFSDYFKNNNIYIYPNIKNKSFICINGVGDVLKKEAIFKYYDFLLGIDLMKLKSDRLDMKKSFITKDVFRLPESVKSFFSNAFFSYVTGPDILVQPKLKDTEAYKRWIDKKKLSSSRDILLSQLSASIYLSRCKFGMENRFENLEFEEKKLLYHVAGFGLFNAVNYFRKIPPFITQFENCFISGGVRKANNGLVVGDLEILSQDKKKGPGTFNVELK